MVILENKNDVEWAFIKIETNNVKIKTNQNYGKIKMMPNGICNLE